MTNKEKASECSSTQIRHIKDEFPKLDNYFLDVIEAEAIIQNLEMAKWKDQQFKEFLEKKKNEILFEKIAPMSIVLEKAKLMDKIINEFLRRTEIWM